MTKLVVGVQMVDTQLAHAVESGFGRVPELLDDAGIGYVVLGADREAAAGASVSPVLAGTVFARRTGGLGIVTAASPQRDHPYNIARRTASLDHISGGRAGWLALHADHSIRLGAPAQGSWAPSEAARGAFVLADAIAAARALWRTWPVESLLVDTPLPRPPHAEVRYADHTGVFSTTGPLNVPTTPQGEPVVFWNYRRDDAQSASVADVAVVAIEEYLSTTPDLPAGVATHARIDGDDPELTSLIDELARCTASVSGVLIRLDIAALPDFVNHTVPELTSAKRIRTRTTTETLRQHLRITRRAEPESHCLRTVFAPT